ncbi:MAG: YigZ family protein [Erysipelotrichaceae bacterium]|nr:YigZ family protein [Erysipelotrichaceae bacterium]MBQ2213119.1 YigZ family protein [Erysipelotrichaceae bacterium]
MYHIKNEVISEIEIKKSKFFGILSPASSIEEAREILSDVRKRYPNATHYCTAMIFGNIQRSNDDGEPSGTAGLPMLECLRHKELDNVVMIVVRYFGGTLLGTGGLVKAYQQSTLSAIALATLTIPVETGQYEITVPYDLISRVENLLQKQAVIIDRQYHEQITFVYQSENDLASQFQEITNGHYAPLYQKTLIVEKEVAQ